MYDVHIRFDNVYYDIRRIPMVHIYYDKSHNGSYSDCESESESKSESDITVLSNCVLLAVFLTHTHQGKAHDTCLSLSVGLDEIHAASRKKVEVEVWDCDGRKHMRVLEVDLVRFEAYQRGCQGGQGGQGGQCEDVYVFEGMGDASPWERTAGVKRGDVVITLIVDPHPTFSRDEVLSRFDLHATRRVSLYDFYYGKDVYLTHLDGSTVHLRYEPSPSAEDHRDQHTSRTTTTQMLSGGGLPYYSVRENESGSGSANKGQSYSGYGDGYRREVILKRGDLYVFFELCVPALPRISLANPLNRTILRKLFGACT
jgi:hypothetical protein